MAVATQSVLKCTADIFGLIAFGHACHFLYQKVDRSFFSILMTEPIKWREWILACSTERQHSFEFLNQNDVSGAIPIISCRRYMEYSNILPLDIPVCSYICVSQFQKQMFSYACRFYVESLNVQWQYQKPCSISCDTHYTMNLAPKTFNALVRQHFKTS